MALQAPYPIDLLLDAAGADCGARLLALGGEQGCVAARAAARHVFSSCLIADRGALNTARSRYPSVEFVSGALEDIPYPSHVFDSVVCHYRMPYFANPEVIMREALRILDADGVFAFTALTVRSNAAFVPALDHALALWGVGASPWRGGLTFLPIPIGVREPCQAPGSFGLKFGMCQ